VGAARGAHLLKAIALLVHVIPLCPSPKGETRSWRVCREGHVCVGCCSLVLFLSPFSHAPWIHFLGGSEVSRGGWCGREHFRAKTFCTYRPFPLFFFSKVHYSRPGIIHLFISPSVHVKTSKAPEPERGSLSLQSPCCLHVIGAGRKVRVKAALTGHHKSPAILLGLVAVLVWGAKSPTNHLK